MAIETDNQGRLIQTVKPGQPIIMDQGVVPQAILDKTLNAEYKHDIDTSIELDRLSEHLPEGSQVGIMASIASRSYEKIKEVNVILGKIQADQTRTVGSKVLLKQELTKNIFKDFDNKINDMARQVFSEIESTSHELFSHDLDLSSTEEQMSSIFAGMIKDGKADIGLLATATKAESKIALSIARNFPSLIPKSGEDNSFQALARIADFNFTPEKRNHLDALVEAHEQIPKIVRRVISKKANFIDPQIMDLLNNNIAGSK